MEKKMLDYIEKNNLSPFNKTKTSVNAKETIFKTKDAKSVYNKVISAINSNFYFADTSNLLTCFPFTPDFEEIKNRQDFFKSIAKNIDNEFLKKISVPKSSWKPNYDAVIVTENEKNLSKLQEFGCTVKFIATENDIAYLERYDLVYVVDCDQFSNFLESLPQAIFVNNLEDAYLERYLILLSSWQENFEVLMNNNFEQETIKELLSILNLVRSKTEILSKEKIFEELENINEKIFSQIKTMTVSGESLLSILKKGIPCELKEIINSEISKTKIPSHLFSISIPLEVDERELDNFIKRQNTSEFTDKSAILKQNSKSLKSAPEKLKKISAELLIFDFISGISNFISSFENYPKHAEELKFTNSKNIFLENAQPVCFNLNNEHKCSILTGANSGGKTTLLEHIIQLVTLSQIGLPVSGNLNLPIFNQVYYFAKNKGSMSKGAFETLLTQMSQINPEGKTLILADEIESVTEPGVAGNIISATAEYFISKDCFLVIATHLGFEIQKSLPKGARIDGIEAKGLDDNFELIVDHNPVIGRLAHSTPELIVEKMANSFKTDYFNFIFKKLKS
ncbi:MAG: hypothetical protein ACOYT4_00685 [Nanoarchaeota archaeon]